MTFVRRAAVGAVCAIAFAAPLALAGTERQVGGSAKAYYLALGDSMAYGLQPTKATKPPAKLAPGAFRTGYVDVFAADLRRLAPRIRVVNYGCPGESTATFLRGKCDWLREGGRLHDPFKGTQLAAALAFLRAHPGKVSPITLTLWGNDLFSTCGPSQSLASCTASFAAADRAQFGSRLTSILQQLRAAAPKAQVIVTGAWSFDVQTQAKTDAFFHALDATIAKSAKAADARVAKMFPVFDPAGKEKATVCKLTFICSMGDPHPTDAGYRAMASAFLAASGYRRP